jgi:hypothetical protein
MLLNINVTRILFLLAAGLSFRHITNSTFYAIDYSFLDATADSEVPRVLLLPKETLNSSLHEHRSRSAGEDDTSKEEPVLQRKQESESLHDDSDNGDSTKQSKEASKGDSNQDSNDGTSKQIIKYATHQKRDTNIATDKNQTNERIAIVVRSMDPVQPIVLERLIHIAEILQREDFKHYDMHLLLDQTRKNMTTTSSMRKYFRLHNASHLRAPKVFGVTEKMILDEFPALAKGYVPGPLIDGTSGSCCGKPLLWQLLIPTFVTFVHYHQEYDHTWVFEDDVWAIGLPLVEVLQIWDGRLKGQNASLVGTRLNYGNMPYTRMTKERHTESFRDILVKMKGTGWQHRNKTLLHMDNQTRSKVWNEWGGNVLPPWSCMSDAVYRHSRDFGDYVYGMVKQNIYQFAECYQMPLAWYGGFKIADVKEILPNVAKDYKDGRRYENGVHLAWEELREKREYTEAEYKLGKLKNSTNVSSLIYHRLFVPPSGNEYRTRRNHPHTCSVNFDFENDMNSVGNCEQVLKNATENATAWIFLGNHPISKVFQNFMSIESPESLFNVLMDDKQSPKKIRDYYKYPPANYDEWQEKYGGESTSDRTEPAGRLGHGDCVKCDQLKLQSRSLGRTLEYLLVESSRDVFFQTANTTTSQETVVKWIAENYHDRLKTVCVVQMDGFEMEAAPWRTTSDFLTNTKKFHEMLEPSCGTIIRLGFLRFSSTSRDIREVVAWDEGARDLVLDNASDGYFIDVSNVKKKGSNDRYSKPMWRMFVKLMGLGPMILPNEKKQ